MGENEDLLREVVEMLSRVLETIDESSDIYYLPVPLEAEVRALIAKANAALAV